MRFILMLFFLSVSAYAFSQGDFDKRLLVKYSADQLTALEKQNPDIVGHMEYYLDHGYTIMPQSGLSGQVSAGTVKLKSLKPGKINIFDADVSFPLDHDVYYTIEGTDQVLVLHGRKWATEMYYKEQKNNQLNKKP